MKPRFSIVFLLPILLLAGCKSAPPPFTDAQLSYIVKPGDTLESVTSAYQKMGVDVWAGAIQMANPSLTSTTVLPIPGTSIIIPARNCIEPKLNEPIEFDGFTVSQFSSQEAAKRLMTQKLKSSGTYYDVRQDVNGKEIMTPHDGFDFFKYPDGKVVRTETVEQYIYACEHYRQNSPDDTNKAYSYTTCDIQAEMAMGNIKDKLVFMTKVQPSIHSYLKGKYLKELPVDVLTSSLNCCDGETSDKFDKILKRDAEAGKTLRDYTKRWSPLYIKNMVWEDDTTLRFSDSTMEIDYYIKELARGDFDGDGNEDALILIGWHTQGSMGGSYTAVVTKTGPDEKVKWVATDKFVQCSPHIVKLVGVIMNQTFSGPPNYKDISKGDAAEDYWILNLEEPIDVAKDPEYPVPDENSPQLNQRSLQINLDVYLKGDYKAYEKFLGKKVEVTGELSQGFTVHHKTPVLIWVRDIKLVD